MPLALAVDWVAVEKAAIAGVSYAKLSAEHGIPETAIRKRASRYAWPTTFRTGPKITGPSQTSVTRAQNEAISVTVADSLAENGQKSSLLASKIALQSLARAPESLPVTSLGDVKTAMQIARTAAGLDRPQVQVAVAMSPGWGAAAQAEAKDWGEDTEEPQE